MSHIEDLLESQKEGRKNLIKVLGREAISAEIKSVLAEVAEETGVRLIETNYGYVTDFGEVGGVLISTDEGLLFAVDAGASYDEALPEEWRSQLIWETLPSEAKALRSALRSFWFEV